MTCRPHWVGAALLIGLAGCSSSTAAPEDAEVQFPVRNPNEVIPAQPPVSGPWYHVVRSAVSSDGLTWHEERDTALVLHASVPAALQFPDGTIRVYFVDFSSGTPERLGCVESRDGGRWYIWGRCAIAGLASVKAVDPAPVLLPDGRARLYYYASGNDVNSTGPHPVDAAISTDGVTFTRETTAFEYDGLVDPDIFWTGQQWMMHVFSLAVGATVRAVSPDGLQFTYAGVLEPRNYGVTRPVRLPDGSFRMYGFPQGAAGQDRFVSFRSPDGLVWTLEPGDRLTAPAGYEITDPYVIPLAAGGWYMVYKRSPRGR